MKSDSKILITGTAGFIGFHLAKKLLEIGHVVHGVDNLNDYYDTNLKLARLDQLKPYDNFEFEKIDIVDYDSINKKFNNFEPDKVVNLAAQAGVRYSMQNPQAYIDANINGFMSILECCRHHKTRGLIYASSSSVYGKNEKIPFSVDDRVDHPISIYAVSKKANELMAHTYSHLYNLRTTGLRFFTVYGPWDRPDMAMNIFAHRIQKGDTISVFNHGQMKRDFTYIDDIINGIISAIERNEKCEIFNLGNSNWEGLIDMIEMIESELGKKAKIRYLGMQPGDIEQTYADIDYSIEKLGYEPTTSIYEGIPKFIRWFKSYYYS
mgnify:CR=1 FL=1|tara:strand:- start:1149 stop:2114 length:966 start_codon:yes stop_codon:yes gene_type:complete